MRSKEVVEQIPSISGEKSVKKRIDELVTKLFRYVCMAWKPLIKGTMNGIAVSLDRALM